MTNVKFPHGVEILMVDLPVLLMMTIQVGVVMTLVRGEVAMVTTRTIFIAKNDRTQTV